ncbi:hypothetical protein [Falsiporphyromonas endometrii]|uniref:Secreted protein n=1 Tax=Falsiporphyromonas endometrii TaxID=1387297 RepID=A0ABV9K9M4_9PORP
MEILILLTIFLILVQLGRLHFREAVVHSIGSRKISISTIFISKHTIRLFLWAVKLSKRCLNLLNTAILSNVQKGGQTTLIHFRFHIIQG